MEERAKRRRTFTMGVGYAKKNAGFPAPRLSRNQRNAGMRHAALLEKHGDVEKFPLAEETPGGWARLFHSWFDYNPLPMMAFDRENLAIMAVNEAAIRHYGYSREEFLAMTIEDIRPSEKFLICLKRCAQEIVALVVRPPADIARRTGPFSTWKCTPKVRC